MSRSKIRKRRGCVCSLLCLSPKSEAYFAGGQRNKGGKPQIRLLALLLLLLLQPREVWSDSKSTWMDAIVQDMAINAS